MECAFCKELIDDVSIFCDMCGEEIKECPGCRKHGKGKMCTACGTPLIGRSSQTAAPAGDAMNHGRLSATPASVPSHPEPNPPAVPESTESTYRLQDDAGSGVLAPELRLLNKNINVDMKIEDDSIIGRTVGPYLSTFGGYKQISSRHCRFNYDPEKGWIVTDLGSTNKTRYNNRELTPNIGCTLSDQGFLKIANIEFFIRILSP